MHIRFTFKDDLTRFAVTEETLADALFLIVTFKM